MAAVIRRTKPQGASKNICAGGLSLRRNIQASTSSTGMVQSSAASPSPVSQQNMKAMYTCPPENDYGTLFNDPQNVHQWAVSSANGSAQGTDGVYAEYSNVTYGNGGCYNASGTGRDMSYPRGSQSSTFVVLPPDPSTMDATSVPQTNPDGHHKARSKVMASLETEARFPSSDFIDVKNSMVQFPNCETWVPGEIACHSSLFHADLPLDICADNYQCIASDYLEENPFPPTWPMEQSYMEERCSDGLVMDPSEPWSPSAVTMDLSISSSYSQGSYGMHYDGSPPSHDSLEDLSQIVPQGWSTSPPEIDVQTHFPYSVGSFENSSEAIRFVSPTSLDVSILITLHSTIRPVGTGQRQCLTSAVFFPEQDPIHYLQNMETPLEESNVRTHSNGEEAKCNARRDRLYKLGPKKDGLYHCPFATNCSHKPDKLKCNYDKHLDSHLKPYRCKVHACVNVAFSSTACLLRHEREAHGMHGHGDKPYLCRYEDCDRSIEGNGFPRRWNLLDHMKRVHSNSGPASAGCASPSTSSAGSSPPAKAIIASRKKRLSNTPQVISTKRTKPLSVACKLASKVGLEPSPLSKGRAKQQIQQQCQQQHFVVAESPDGLNSTGFFEYQHITTDYPELNFRLLDAGQVF
ncbi:hypothetical protein MMC11_001739 [Xylographa trunciseda]|nr:hypothetical protein [Xylographa trunciseda]